MFPDNVLSTHPRTGPLKPPKDEAFNPRMSRHRGGTAIGDSSLGLDVRTWTLQIDGDNMLLSNTTMAPTVVLTVEGVKECSLAFDQNMRIAIAYQTDDASHIYFYNSLLASYDTLSISGAKYARALTDDVRRAPNVSNLNDVLFFYVLGTTLCMRVQRERFAIEYPLYDVANYRLEHVGMNDHLRVQMNLVYDDPNLYLSGVPGGGLD